MRRAVPPIRQLRAGPSAARVATLVAALAVTLVVALLPGPAGGDRFADARGAAVRAANSASNASAAGSMAEEEPESVERGRGSTTPAPAAPVRREARPSAVAKRSAVGAAPRTPPDTAGRQPAPAAHPAGPAVLQVFRH
ncbi:hypothetical protein ACIHEI_15790 [Kitasatospora sp. NPDC051984]|uniref:hypothetical protein n=1 Tax=Kitasatospora sp. NPDC051984 TaxID=3364059 RepID=UPI0037C64537